MKLVSKLKLLLVLLMLMLPPDLTYNNNSQIYKHSLNLNLVKLMLKPTFKNYYQTLKLEPSGNVSLLAYKNVMMDKVFNL